MWKENLTNCSTFKKLKQTNKKKELKKVLNSPMLYIYDKSSDTFNCSEYGWEPIRKTNKQ